jgi:hypothetical protein
MAKMGGFRCARCSGFWQLHQLQPHRIRTVKRSRDPAFAAQLEDIVATTASLSEIDGEDGARG